MKREINYNRIRQLITAGLLVVAASLLLGSCEPDPADIGGAGADFDETLYYTKTDVDALISELYTKTEVDAAVEAVRPVVGTASEKTLPDVGWAGRTGGFTVPEGATSVLVKVIAANSNTTVVKGIFYMVFSETGSAGTLIGEISIPPGTRTTYLGWAAVGSGATTMYGWHDSDSGHGGSAADLTDVTIRIQPVLWLK